jgi:biopolymer transport protein ExbD
MAELTTSEKSGRRSSLRKLSPRVDLTAMVDLAFLLITFFMLATTLSKPHMLGVIMPVKNTPAGSDPESRTMTLCLGKNNQVLWYLGMAEKPLTTPAIVNYGKNGLRAAIINTSNKILTSTGKPLIVVVKPSSHSLYSNLVSTLDELNIVSIPSYAIADISAKDIDLLRQQKAF